jgi:hypothetical protein
LVAAGLARQDLVAVGRVSHAFGTRQRATLLVGRRDRGAVVPRAAFGLCVSITWTRTPGTGEPSRRATTTLALREQLRLVEHQLHAARRGMPLRSVINTVS